MREPGFLRRSRMGSQTSPRVSWKVMTVIATIVTPITFLASVYGMNFDVLPEKGWKWAYPMFWVVCLAMAGGLLVWFRKRKWL
ncbi:MAG: hypothetical protein H7210_06890 [Pyrinomonadaceae bacterium]|nr:hypothetical protein [Phycisphaerales bacterium]